jgi:dTMP kinase
MKPKRFYGKGLPKVDPSQLKGKLIVIEGADGSGRSTQIELLRQSLERRGYPTVSFGLKRSTLVAAELEKAMQGNTLSPITLSLFCATDFADQLENNIIPALKSGFIVAADRYIYTLMARSVVRGARFDWIREVYDIALVPDAVFYLKVRPKVLVERNFQKQGVLDYWESGMDILRSRDMFESFIKYQGQMQRVFKRMEKEYGFVTVNGDRAPAAIQKDLQQGIEKVLDSSPEKTEPVAVSKPEVI